MNFQDKKVLITGGGSGIGRAVATAFVKGGAKVSICGRDPEKLTETAQELGVETFETDVTSEADIAALFAAPYDIVVANAGAGWPGKVAELSLEDWNRTLAVNLTGTFLTFREALKGMHPGGRLIAVASTASLQGGTNIAAYSAAKHGVLGLVRSLAKEVAKKGITCNAVCPGFVDTDMAEAAIAGVMARFNVDRDRARAMVTSGNPMARLIDADEVASAVLFLASSGASSVNGHALSVSGGEI